MSVAKLTTPAAPRASRSRRRRLLHPAGRSFVGELELNTAGTALLSLAARGRVTVRVSKGAGTRGSRLDIRGLAIRLHLPGRDLDLLLSTAGRGRLTRHLPAPRRSFDAVYGTITPYRTGAGDKVYLLALPDPDGRSLGGALADVSEGDRVLLAARQGETVRPVGRVILRRALPAQVDAALAFDPVRNSLPALHPTGLIHGVRAFAYHWSQRYRRATSPPDNKAAVRRTGTHR